MTETQYIVATRDENAKKTHVEHVKKWQENNRDYYNSLQRKYRKQRKVEREVYKMIIEFFTYNETLDRKGLQEFIDRVSDLAGEQDK